MPVAREESQTDPGYAARAPLVVRSGGMVLREWRQADVPAMVALFDTAEMDR